MTPYYDDQTVKIYHGDCLKVLNELPENSINTCITSPPYYNLRTYLPDVVVLKDDAPEWVKKYLLENNIKPIN